MWEIRGKENIAKAVARSLEYNGEWLGERYVSATIESPTPIDFRIGDYVVYRGERFEINYDPGKIKSAPRYAKVDAFKYDSIKFNSLADELTRCDFLDVVPGDNGMHFTGLPKFSFYAETVKELADRIQANLDRAYGKGTWIVEVDSEFVGKTGVNVQVDNIKVRGALEIAVNDFEAYFTISNRRIIIGAAGIPASHLFRYGKGNGLFEIEQNADTEQLVVTRLRAYGSERNIPHRYYNALSGANGEALIPDHMAVRNLMLPDFPYSTLDPYIDSQNISKLGVREGTVFFDGSQEGLEEIFPSIEGMTAEGLRSAGVACASEGALDELVWAESVSDNGVGVVDGESVKPQGNKGTFKIQLKDIGFDINDHLTSQSAVISFKSGKLAGREFEIVGREKNDAGYQLELNRVYDEGLELFFPYSDYNAAEGDKFVLLHIEMPEVYIKAAARRLLASAKEWLSKNDYSRSVYAPKIDEIFMARQHDVAMASGGTIASLHDTLREGMLMLFEDPDMGIANASVFIDRLVIKEGESPVPTYDVTLREEKSVGTIQRIQNKIDSLSSGKGQGSGGYNAAQIRSLVDAYGGTRFLSKLKDDRTVGKVASDKGFEIGNFLSGASGGMFGIDAESGDSFAEVARLYVRVKAFFEELMVIKAGVLAGKQYITPGGGIKCVRVEEFASHYRCYFLSKQDGERAECRFEAGDQAISEMFNVGAGEASEVSNRRYWRLVTAVSNDALTDDAGNHYGYINLSKFDCESGSDIPMAGDEICQLGNRTKDDRRAAMVFSTVDSDAPSLKLYSGIGAGATSTERYTLADREIVAFGKNPITGEVYFKCYGDSFIGDPEGSTYIQYDKANKEINVKARLNMESTVGDGDRTLGDIASSAEAAGHTLVIDNQVAGLACDADGAVVGDYPTARCSVWRGSEEVADGVSFTIEESLGVEASIDTHGKVTFSSMTADTASVTVLAEVEAAGVSLSGTISLYKAKPGADGSPAVVYSILPSVGSVVRDVDGKPSEEEVSVTKYKSEGGGGIAATDELWCYVRRYVNGEPGSWSLICGPGTMTGTAVLADTDTALEFELRDGTGGRATRLDRQIVRVLTDAANLRIGGVNLLAHTNRGVDGWIVNASADGPMRVEETIVNGVRGIKVTNEARVPNPGWQMIMREIPADLFKKDARYVLSFDSASSTDPLIVYPTAALSDSSDALITASPWEYLWSNLSRHSIRLVGAGPGSSPNQHYLAIVIRPGAIWGSFTIGNLKLEEGNIATEWSAAPGDGYDYITESILDARKESGSFDGGLILATLLRLGFTDADGIYRVRSGISGIADHSGAPAIWMGGDMVDADDNPDNLPPATAMFRHDGTGYVAGNTLRFKENRVEVGDSVELNATGLVLRGNDGGEKLVVHNGSVGDDIAAVSQSTADLYTSSATPIAFSRLDQPGREFGFRGNASVELPIGNMSLRQGDGFSLTLGIQTGVAIPYDVDTAPWLASPYVVVDVLCDGIALDSMRTVTDLEPEWTDEERDGIRVRVFAMRLEVPYDVSVEIGGRYSLRATLSGGGGQTAETHHATATVSMDGTATWRYADQNILGNDGLLSKFGQAAMLVTDSQWAVLVGDYGLRITPSGFQATTNGGDGPNGWRALDITKLYR